jgi:hypothetical protein
MSNINPTTLGIDDFVQNYFNPNLKNIIFWDTCSLLDILRLPYRNGDINAFKNLVHIKALIDSNTIHSLCSSLTIAEWNEHEIKVKQETQDSLLLTSKFHKHTVDIINNIFTTAHSTTRLDDKGLVEELEHIADEILSKTQFITTDEIANSALWRVANKKPPASKKREFKDCAIWETALAIGSGINGSGNKIVFFTVNTDDYIDKSRTPQVMYGNILSEATSIGVNLCLTYEDSYNNLL